MKQLITYLCWAWTFLVSVLASAQCDLKNDLAEALFGDSKLVTYFAEKDKATEAYQLLHEVHKASSTEIADLNLVIRNLTEYSPAQLKQIVDDAGGFQSWKNTIQTADELTAIVAPLKSRYTQELLDALKKDFLDPVKLKKIVDDGLVDSWKLIRSTNVETLETFSILYKNNGFKGYFDDLLSNPTSRKFSDILSVEDEAVLKYYTTNPGYKDLNKALRGGEGVELTEEFIAQEKLMNKALDKLPSSTYNNSDELLYRIENLTEEQITNLYKKGENYTSKGFYSSTYSEDAVIDAMRNRSHTVLIRIKGKNGKLIEGLSTLPKEKEILFKSGTGFKVDDVGFSPNPDDFMTPIRTVWLTEL